MVLHFCLHRLRKWPSEYYALSNNERLFIQASIICKIDAEKEAHDKIKNR